MLFKMKRSLILGIRSLLLSSPRLDSAGLPKWARALNARSKRVDWRTVHHVFNLNGIEFTKKTLNTNLVFLVTCENTNPSHKMNKTQMRTHPSSAEAGAGDGIFFM